ncbi:MAG: hypothetical protein HKN51_15530 [Saprospiraceae bacterium]|nr:hypothetical protein [Saprospiraceae bacterium]
MKPTKPDKKGESQVMNGKVDTIFWTEIDRTKEYNSTIENLDLEKKDSYNVSLLMPFEIERTDQSEVTNNATKLGKMANYYAGVKMALKKLEEEGINLNVNVLDSESGKFDVKIQQCKNADVIIGPRSKEQLKVTANFGRINNIPVISPWKSGSKISENNPFFVQLKTGLKDHFKKIIEHAKSEFSDDQIILLGRNTKREDLTYMRYMQGVAAALNQDNNVKPLQEFYVNEDSLKLGEFAFDSIFIQDQTTVFVLPNWSFLADEDFVYNTVRKMSGEKGLENVVVYGMPILLDSDKIKYDLHRGLNMRICRSSFVDRHSIDVKEFKQAYFDQYAGLPSDEAYEGYDMMVFIGRSMFNYGKKFQYFLDTYEQSLLQTKFDIQKVFKDDESDDFKNIQYFQNEHLYILTFEDNKFVARQ